VQRHGEQEAFLGVNLAEKITGFQAKCDTPERGVKSDNLSEESGKAAKSKQMVSPISIAELRFKISQGKGV